MALGDIGGEGGIVLKKSVVKDKEREFFPTLLEHKGRTETILIRSGERTSSNRVIIYTVPANTTTFITGAWLSQSAKGSPGGEKSELAVENVGSLLEIPCRDPNSGQIATPINTTISMSYPMPIKMESGQSMTIDNPSGCQTNFGFVGWEEQKKVI